MKKLFNKLTFLIITVLIALIIFFYIGVFSPLQDELEKTLIENFKNTVSIAEINVENYISRAKEGAESLSSRTMIKSMLNKFNRGDISYLEVKQYTQPKYSDGAKVLDHVIKAVRFCNGEKLIAGCDGISGDKSIDMDLKEFNQDVKKTKIYILHKKNLVIINSPIILEQEKLGNDIVVFDLKPLFSNLNKERINYSIFASNEVPNKFVHNNKEVIDYRKILDTNYYLRAQLPQTQLNEGINELLRRVIIGIITALIIITILFRIIIKQTYHKVIDRLKNKIDKITKLSETDYLLKIYNRSKFKDELTKEISRVKRYGSNLSLIMFDVDYFKKINDEYGHDKGDDVLIKITEIIKDIIREADVFARYGGDEFIILTPNTDLKEAGQLAERLRKEVAESEFDQIGSVTCSFGVTEFGSDDDIDSFIKKVDDALYKSKEKGRNKVEKKK